MQYVRILPLEFTGIKLYGVFITPYLSWDGRPSALLPQYDTCTAEEIGQLMGGN